MVDALNLAETTACHLVGLCWASCQNPILLFGVLLGVAFFWLQTVKDCLRFVEFVFELMFADFLGVE